MAKTFDSVNNISVVWLYNDTKITKYDTSSTTITNGVYSFRYISSFTGHGALCKFT